MHLDVRVSAHKLPENLIDTGGVGKFQPQAYTDGAIGGQAVAAQTVPGRIAFLQKAGGLPCQNAARFRQRHIVGGSLKQLCSQFLFQLLNVTGQNWLGNIELLCGAAEAQSPGQGEEFTQTGGVHGKSAPLRRRENPWRTPEHPGSGWSCCKKSRKWPDGKSL